MNIFYLDHDPKICATYHNDKHVVKMVLETAQMLSTVQHHNGITAPYKPTHANHPCTKWAATSTQNYKWLLEHGIALCEEYSHRYNKEHKCEQLITGPLSLIPILPTEKLTPFAQAMPEQHKRENAVDAYRQYYIQHKARFAKWTNRVPPHWWPSEINT